MLVLSRKRHELVRIGRNITIRVADIRGDKVRLRIVAPPSWPVHREEVAIEIQRAGQLADPLEAALQRVAELEKQLAALSPLASGG